MDEHECTRARCDSRLKYIGINLESVGRRLNEYGHKTILRDCQHTGYECVGRNEDVVADSEAPQFDVGSQYELESIESVGTSDSVARTDIPSIVSLKLRCLLTAKIAPRGHNRNDRLTDFFSVSGGHLLEVQKGNFIQRIECRE